MILEKSEAGTSCDNRNDRGKTHQGKPAREGVGWTNKVDVSRTSDSCSISDEGIEITLGSHDRHLQRARHLIDGLGILEALNYLACRGTDIFFHR